MFHSTKTDDPCPPTSLSRPAAYLLDLATAARPTLLSIARRITGCPFQAEDVVQDVFLKLLPVGAPFHDDINEAYLYRMVRNLAIDRTRRQQLEERLFTDLDDTHSDSSADSLTAEQELIGSQALGAIEMALAGLSARDRAIFTQHRLDGVAQKDIAAHFRLSPAAVCTIVKKVHGLCQAALQAMDSAARDSAARPGGALQ
ncbi:sigma-70 family RNA polymerase sigma factor [Insolitispirillum peregrinum]|uniref:sigma-70 family RNA polymerase sigma factor n=1 Tax=Insolitispirillum peregrinum TaxID=80876 RepID=UPI00360CCB55